MIRAGVGHSLSASGSEAAEQATTTAMGKAKLAKADLAFVFATADYQSEYTQCVRKYRRFRGARI